MDTYNSAIIEQEKQERERTVVINKVLKREDGGNVLLASHGAELSLASSLYNKDEESRLWGKEWTKFMEMILEKINDKNVLVVPGYATNAFIFKMFGARNVVGADVDFNSIAWLNAVKDYYKDEDIGRLLAAGGTDDREAYNLYRQGIQRCGSVESFIVESLSRKVKNREEKHPVEGVSFVQAALGKIPGRPDIKSVEDIYKDKEKPDFIYVPYLLGINKGIETEEGIKTAFESLWETAKDGTILMVMPFSGSEDMAEMFQSKPGIINNLKNLLPPGKFEVIDRMYLNSDLSTALLKVIKPESDKKEKE